MKSISRQITGREPTLEEQLYDFHGFWFGEDSPTYQRLVASAKARFNEGNFIPENHPDYTVSGFNLVSSYVHLNEAFGDEFSESVDALIEGLRGLNDRIITEAKAKTEPDKKSSKVDFPKGVLVADGAYDIKIRSEIDNELVDLLRKNGLKETDVSVEYKMNDVNDITCIVYANDMPLFAYTLTPKNELEKEVRTPGYEIRNYRVLGTTEQLDTLEKAFAYLQVLGEEGHSSGITIGYDGDGNARMMFERADGQALTFPDEHLELYLVKNGGDEKRISGQEFLRLVGEHKSFSWQEGDKKVRLTYRFREDEDTNRDVGHFSID